MANVKARFAGDGLRLRVEVREESPTGQLGLPVDLTGATIEAWLGMPGQAVAGMVTVEDAAGGVLLAEWATGMVEPSSEVQVVVEKGGARQTVVSRTYPVRPSLGA